MPTKNFDVLETTDPALQFAPLPQTWIIAPTIIISSSGNNAADSAHAFSKLINHGHLISTSGVGTGAYFHGGHGTINNAVDGDIFGFAYGVVFSGAANKLSNFGSIIGRVYFGTYLSAGTTTTVIDNHGFMFGYTAAILDASDDGATVHNYGILRSGGWALSVNLGGVGQRTVVDNHGTMKGGIASITTTNGSLSLTNAGTLAGLVDLNAPGARDIIDNSGKIRGPVFLGDGNDLFRDLGQGRSGKVFGEDGNDKLIGGIKADIFNGGLGKDTQTGKLGGDVFDFDNPIDSPVGALHDVITDFNHAQHDRIDVSTIDAINFTLLLNEVFGFRGTHGFTAAGQIRYVKSNLPGTAHDKTTIFGNTDSDPLTAEFQIELKGLHNLVAGDFVL